MSAEMSPCGRYRYRLDRLIDLLGEAPVAFCLHNPSTADSTADDPTLRRAIGYARRWHATTLTFVNVWAGRATKPADLWRMEDPRGPDNEAHIAQTAREMARSGGTLVFAWGRPSPPSGHRAQVQTWLVHIEKVVRDVGCNTAALGFNVDGSPKHPLYVRKDASLVAY